METMKIVLKEGQKIFFSSDLHFGHNNVISFCKRPFSNVKEMEYVLIENFNKNIGEDDILFLLGDVFWFNNSRDIKRVFNKLHCKNIYIVPGNHDDFQGYHRLEKDRVEICQDIVCLFLVRNNNIWELWLSHYPMMTWPHRETNKQCLNLFGHIHSSPARNEGLDQNLPLHPNQFDVGVDAHNYLPFEFRF